MADTAFIVTTAVAVQPVPAVYTITAVPAATPVTTPVAEFTVATAVVLLLHTPPVVVLLRAVVPPIHAVRVPVTEAGRLFTVATAYALQPVPSV